ncbi:helix-turn-helix domain-containing protein [Leucobacter allii]|uniref:AraC-like ligand-binding domain-containing protein n=1 Tax=Leucobacter allii TaxID=2932247 RepID=UPI001FD0C4E8|nr:helix-turn-helix domain-containing protein [Leucobacter allii]UOR01914.1 helix-turn-helix domain-containing protein [Leucobacter allii]
MSTATRPEVFTATTNDLSEYAALVHDSVMPLAVESRHRRFAGRMRTITRGAFVCIDVEAPEHVVERTPELIAAGAGNDFYKLSLMLSGEGTVMQDDREAVLRAGDLAIYDTSRPYSLLSGEGARTAIVMFPRELLPLPPAEVGRLTAVRFAKDAGLAAGISPFLTHLMDHLEMLATPAGSRLPRNIVDLLGTLLASEFDRREAGERLGGRGSSGALLQRILGYIEAHLGEPDLGPERIAAAHFISPRYLQVLFQRNGLTVSSWVREQRLARCFDELVDPTVLEQPIAAVAARWGMLEPTHFSRAFKKRYGISPRQARREAGLGVAA